jgi:hypothetical protein
MAGLSALIRGERNENQARLLYSTGPTPLATFLTLASINLLRFTVLSQFDTLLLHSPPPPDLLQQSLK